MDSTSTDFRDPMLGRLLDRRYRLERLLGRGGMGTVYAATQETIGRAVAVKILRADLASDPAMAERFEREARAATMLVHPHIVTIHDFGRAEDGACFLVMELCAGESLRQTLERDGPMPIGRALRITEQICDALAAAHAKGLLHRDIKPDNFMLTRVGDRGDFVKVLDFGIAKLVEAVHDGPRTATGMLVGTPQYMAPEYIRNEPYDHRADLYAVGILLDEMLRGVHAFGNENPTSVLLAHLRGELPPMRRADVQETGPVASLLRRALALRPEDRFQSAVEMREAVHAILGRGEQRGPFDEDPVLDLFAPPRVENGVEAAPAAPLPSSFTSAPTIPPRAYAELVTGPATGPATLAAHGAARPGSRPTPRLVRRRVLAAVAVTALALGGVTTAYVLEREEGSPPSRAVASPPRVSVAAPAPSAAALDERADPPKPNDARSATTAASVVLHFRSSPEGAAVVYGDEVVGETPLDLPRSAAAASVLVRFEHEGYGAKEIEVTPDREQTFEVILASAGPRPSARPTEDERPEPDEAIPSPAIERALAEPSAPPPAIAPTPPPPRAEPTKPPARRADRNKRKVFGMEFEN